MMEILYKKKVIRDFLSLYSEKYWTQLVSHILEYGIILFKKKYTISALSPEDIFEIVENFKKELNIYDKKIIKKNTSSRPTSKNKNTFSSRSKEKNLMSSSSSKSKTGSSAKNIFKPKSSVSIGKKNTIDKDRPSTSNNKNKTNNISTLSRKSQTPSKQKQNEMMFKFNNSHLNTSKNKNITSEKPKSKSKSRINQSALNNPPNSRKTILTLTNSNLNNSINKNNISINSGYSNYTYDSKETKNNLSTLKNKPSITINTNEILKTKKSDESSKLEDKIIHYTNSSETENIKPNLIPPANPKPKAESKIKALIERDKKKYMKQKYTNLSGTLSKITTQTPILSNTEKISNIPLPETEDNNDMQEDIKLPLKNESSIISLEDKLNGLTMKLSKLKASINNTKANYYSKTLNPQNPSSLFPSYLNNVDSTGDNFVNKQIGGGSNLINTTDNNDEDYLGEDQIDLNNNLHNQQLNEEENTSGNMEMRCYRKMNSLND